VANGVIPSQVVEGSFCIIADWASLFHQIKGLTVCYLHPHCSVTYGKSRPFQYHKSAWPEAIPQIGLTRGHTWQWQKKCPSVFVTIVIPHRFGLWLNLSIRGCEMCIGPQYFFRLLFTATTL
jgi:hypothetical protein